MNHYHRQLSLAASPAAVYQALATQQGVRSWWTQTCDVAASVGGHASFRFGEHHKVMQIASLVPEREVRWHCLEAVHNIDTFQHKNEWAGTDIVFRLTPQPGGKTLLDFEHVGLTPGLDCFAICERGWNHYLGSLQSQVEEGQGAPYVPAETSCSA